MKKAFILILFFFFNFIHSQEFSPDILELSEDPSIKEFEFLKKELEGVQVVMLGENSHYDGNVFEIKTKIVEFLFQEMGFTTIAFESGIYDVWNAQKEIKNGSDVKESLRNSLFSIWSKRNEFQNFMAFYETNKKDLKLFGFDFQITGNNSFNKLSEELFEYSKKIKFKLKLNQEDFELLLESITNSGTFDEEDISFNDFKLSLTELQKKISQQKDSEEKFYWNQITKSLLELGNDAKNNTNILSAFNVSASDNNRDKQMADNLLAYIKQNPNEKIICWGANAHFTNKTTSVTEPIIKDFIPMGSYVKNELKNKVYSLACITAEDSIFIQDKWHKTPIDSKSFEYELKKNKATHLFVSSNQKEMNRNVLNRFFSPITFIEGNLNELHDGYLFFKNVFPSTIVETENHKNDIKTEYIPTTESKQDFSEYEFLKNSVSIQEIVIHSKRTPYDIMSRVIDSLDSNYPNTSFSSKMNTNVIKKIAETKILDFEFTANQYDWSYTNHSDRSLKSLQQVKWNISDDFKPETLREYHGLVYNSPIQYAQFLKKRKFKKFHFILEETKSYNNEEIYVISFSTSRKHSSYTKRVYLSNYSGYLYVNTKDFAVVKIFENWEITEFPDSFKEGYKFKNTLSKYISKEYISESTITDFIEVDGLYFINYSENIIYGEIYDSQRNKEKFSIFVDSKWNDFNILNPKKIRPKSEEHLFKNVRN